MPLRSLLPAATRYVGVDLSPVELRRGARDGRECGVVADMSMVPLAAGAADAVTVSMALMLTTELDRTLAEIARVLRSGGLMVVLVPTQWPLQLSDVEPLLRLSLPLRGPGAMPRGISVRSIRQRLADADVTVTDVERQRFGFALRQPEDAALAVSALYTPGRSQRARDQAVASLCRLRIGTELPVPLLRIVAKRA